MYLAIVEMDEIRMFQKCCDGFDDAVDTLIDTLTLDACDAIRLRDRGDLIVESVNDMLVRCYVDYAFE